jgi:hypothetical protein
MGHDPDEAAKLVLRQVMRETVTAFNYLSDKVNELKRRIEAMTGDTTTTHTTTYSSDAYARGRAAVTGAYGGGRPSWDDDDLNDDPVTYTPGDVWRGYSGNGYHGGGGGYNRGNTPLWTPPKPKTGIVGADLGAAVNREVKEIAATAPAKTGSFWDDVEPDANVPLGAEDATEHDTSHHTPLSADEMAEHRSMMLKSLESAGMSQSEIDTAMASYDSAIGGAA